MVGASGRRYGRELAVWVVLYVLAASSVVEVVVVGGC